MSPLSPFSCMAVWNPPSTGSGAAVPEGSRVHATTDLPLDGDTQLQAEVRRLQKLLDAKDKKIADLEQHVQSKDDHIEKLEQDLAQSQSGTAPVRTAVPPPAPPPALPPKPPPGFQDELTPVNAHIRDDEIMRANDQFAASGREIGLSFKHASSDRHLVCRVQ